MVMPTETRATTSSPSRTGTTERIEGPRVPVNCWVNGSPSGAVPRSPTNGLPMLSGFGWVKRVRSRSITTTKSTSVSSRTCSAYGWSMAVGSGESHRAQDGR